MLPRQEARARLGLDPDRRLVLYVGYLRRMKGIDILVDSLEAGVPGFPAGTWTLRWPAGDRCCGGRGAG